MFEFLTSEIREYDAQLPCLPPLRGRWTCWTGESYYVNDIQFLMEREKYPEIRISCGTKCRVTGNYA